MKANMFLALNRCNDILFYIKFVDGDLHVVGLDSSILTECLIDEVNKLDRDILFVPRRIVKADEQSLGKCFEFSESVLIGCIPLDTGGARRLAKIHKLSVVVVIPTSIRIVNESQINFMHQSGGRNKYIEIHMQPFLKTFTAPNLNVLIEKSFYLLGNIIERALKLDVGIIVSTASSERSELLSLTHLDIILFYMGFSKRERRLVMEVYPTELLLTWLSYR